MFTNLTPGIVNEHASSSHRPNIIRLMAQRRTSQETLPGTPAGRRRRYCRRCGRPLTNPDSRRAGYGPDCDPENRPGAAAQHHVDQDTLPGT